MVLKFRPVGFTSHGIAQLSYNHLFVWFTVLFHNLYVIYVTSITCTSYGFIWMVASILTIHSMAKISLLSTFDMTMIIVQLPNKVTSFIHSLIRTNKQASIRFQQIDKNVSVFLNKKDQLKFFFDNCWMTAKSSQHYAMFPIKGCSHLLSTCICTESTKRAVGNGGQKNVDLLVECTIKINTCNKLMCKPFREQSSDSAL